MEFNEEIHSYTLRGEYKSNRVGFQPKLKVKKAYKPFLSVTTFIKRIAPMEDWDVIAERYAKKHKMSVKKVIYEWRSIANKALEKGTRHHKNREDEIAALGGIVIRAGEDGLKRDNSLILTAGNCYLEKMLWIEELELCGTADVIIVTKDNKVFIRDYKTNKSISKRSWDLDFRGKIKPCSPPLEHLDYCDITTYSLQLSLYMYMVLLHNPALSFGGMEIWHELFSGVTGEYVKTLKIPITYYEKEIKDMIEERNKELTTGTSKFDKVIEYLKKDKKRENRWNNIARDYPQSKEANKPKKVYRKVANKGFKPQKKTW